MLSRAGLGPCRRSLRGGPSSPSTAPPSMTSVRGILTRPLFRQSTVALLRDILPSAGCPHRPSVTVPPHHGGKASAAGFPNGSAGVHRVGVIANRRRNH